MRTFIGYCRMKVERRARWDARWRGADALLQRLEDRYWGLLGKEIIECYGDSHVKVFRRLNYRFPRMGCRFRTISVMGATAYGLGSDNSGSNARAIFLSRLAGSRAGRVLFMLGEVDTGYLLWALAEKRRCGIEKVVEQAVERYQGFLISLGRDPADLIVCSSPLPTVDDGHRNPEYASIRNTVQASKVERTEVALLFNSKLQKMALARGYGYLDLDTPAYDVNSRTVHHHLISANRNDHHYDEVVFSDIIYQRLQPILSGEKKMQCSM